MSPRVGFANMAEHVLGLGHRWRLALKVLGLELVLAGCKGTPMAVTEISAALSDERGATLAEAAESVLLSEGFVSALARAVERKAGYRAAEA